MNPALTFAAGAWAMLAWTSVVDGRAGHFLWQASVAGIILIVATQVP